MTDSMHEKLKFHAVLRSTTERENLEAVLADSGRVDLDVSIDDISNIAPMIGHSLNPDVLLVDVDLNNGTEMEALAAILEKGQGMAVLVTSEEVPIEGMRRLMHLGVADFIPQPMTTEGILGGLEAASGMVSPGRRGKEPGKALTFIRASGGVGATTLAIQTAIEMQDRYSQNDARACLLDFDLQYGNLALALDIRPNLNLYQILEAPARLDASFLRACMTRHESGVEVLAAPGSIVPLQALTAELATRIITIARSSFDFVIIDMPHAWTDWTEDVLTSSNLVTMVTDLHVTDLHRTHRLFQLITEQELEDMPLAVLVNRFEKGWGGNWRKKEAEKALGRKIDGFIRNDWRTALEALDRGVVLKEIKANSKIEKDIREFFDDMTKAHAIGYHAVPMPQEN